MGGPFRAQASWLDLSSELLTHLLPGLPFTFYSLFDFQIATSWLTYHIAKEPSLRLMGLVLF